MTRDEQVVPVWMASTGWFVPRDLLDVWQAVGGIEMFESEELLEPLDATDVGITAENDRLRASTLDAETAAMLR